jgi:hypothetical protein
MILAGCSVGHVSSIATLKQVHSLCLLAGASAALYVLVSLQGARLPVLSAGSVTNGFLGLIIPIMVGFFSAHGQTFSNGSA